MRILLTGASGFLGKQIFDKLTASYDVITLGRSAQSTIQADLCMSIPSLPELNAVVHVAGKAHSIPVTESEIKEFYEINFEGTKKLCKALEEKRNVLKSFIFISTVAVYGLEKGECISEDEPLLGTSPYAKSKIQAEEYLKEWGRENNIRILILRLPLIFDFKASGNLGKMISQIEKRRFFGVGSKTGSKSIVYSQDIANHMSTFLEKEGVFNLTDGYHPTMNEIAEVIRQRINVPAFKKLPLGLLKVMARFGDLLGTRAPLNTEKLNKLISNLTFNDQAARKRINWNPTRIIDL